MILCERQISWKCWVIVYRLPFLSLANEFPGNCRCLKLSCIKWDRSIEILGKSFLWECFADKSIFVVVSHGRWSEAFPFSPAVWWCLRVDEQLRNINTLPNKVFWHIHISLIVQCSDGDLCRISSEFSGGLSEVFPSPSKISVDSGEEIKCCFEDRPRRLLGPGESY